MSTVLLFLAGGALLVAGAELLVRGASTLATAAGISPLVVGLTVVAFGTSAPELAVSTGSALAGQAGVALGNVVGSNIFNVLFILGVSALITPLVVSRQLVRLDVPLMILVSGLVWALALDGRVGRTDGLFLVVGIVAYTVFLVVQSRREEAARRAGTTVTAPEGAAATDSATPGRAGDAPAPRWGLNLALVAVGLAMLVVGSGWFVRAAVETAAALGVSELVIGLTVIAAGTSLPEVATSITAALRGERDVAVGNVVGSNIFNLLAVLGVSSMVAPDGVAVSTGALTFDIPVMTAVAVATLPIFFHEYLISRWEGAVFVLYYLAYTGWLVLSATDHPALDEFGAAMIGFAIPLTVLTLIVITVGALRDRRPET